MLAASLTGLAHLETPWYSSPLANVTGFDTPLSPVTFASGFVRFRPAPVATVLVGGGFPFLTGNTNTRFYAGKVAFPVPHATSSLSLAFVQLQARVIAF